MHRKQYNHQVQILQNKVRIIMYTISIVNISSSEGTHGLHLTTKLEFKIADNEIFK